MPARSSAMLHPVVAEGSVALTTAYGTPLLVGIQATVPNFNNGAWVGLLETVTIQVTTIVTAASITFRLTADAAGDVVLLPDTTATLSTGVTTATVGAVTYSAAGVALSNIYSSSQVRNGIVYLWAKTDAGTATMTETTIIWRE